MAKGTQINEEQLDAIIPVASDLAPLPVAEVADPGISEEVSRTDHVHVGGVSGGDMTKAVYDANDDGIADNAAAIAGTDVDPDIAPEDGQVLTWDDYNEQWIADDPTGGIEEAPIDSTPYSRQDAGWVAAAGTGDVVGPAEAVDGHIAVFDTETGKLIKDGGPPAGGGDVYGDAAATDEHLVVFDTDGYHIKDGGVPGAGGASIIEIQVFN